MKRNVGGVKLRKTGLLLAILVSGVTSTLVGHVPQLPRAYQGVFGPGTGGSMYLESLYLPPVTTGPWSPSWSPNGNQIAFAMQGSLWKVPASGGEAIQLTVGPTYDSQPNWSPEGRRLVFTRDDGHVIDLWMIDSDGSNARQLTHSKAFAVDPRWFPDGQRILYVTNDDGGPLQFWTLMLSDGSTSQLLTDSARNITPALSPDGKSIVFVSNRRWEGKRIPGTGGVWTWNIDEPEPRLLIQEETAWHARPVWSPDGKKIAYMSFRAGHNQLWVASAASGNPYRLTDSDGETFTPTWSPDNQHLAYIDNSGGQFSLWQVPAVGGKARPIEIDSLRYRTPMGRLEVSTLEQGQKTAARIYIQASDGKGYAPPGAFHRMVVVTNDHYFHSQGSFALDLPVGETTIEVIKGFEYQPQKRTLQIREGETTRLDFELDRLIHMAERGWYSGDNHLHLNYGGIYQATPKSLMLEAESEDLNLVNDLVANYSGTRIYDLQYFEGKLNDISTPNRLIYFNEEYRPSFAGHLSLLNLKEFIYPQFNGSRGTALAANYPTNSQVLDRVHDQGGVAGYVHPFTRSGADPSEYNYGGAREFPVNAALGNVDFFDVMCIWSDEYVTADVWYRILNLGFRVPASAGTDAMTNYWRAPAIGTTRVYVKSGSPLDYGNWIRGLTEGRSFVTSGPLLFFQVDGHEPGQVLTLPPEDPSEVRVAVEAKSIFPMSTLDIMVNGEVAASFQLEDPDQFKIETEVEINQSGWIAARVTGPDKQHLVMDTYLYAHTNPVYLVKGGQPVHSPEDARYFLKWIDTVLGMIESSDSFDTPQQKQVVVELWQRARVVYETLSH